MDYISGIISMGVSRYILSFYDMPSLYYLGDGSMCQLAFNGSQEYKEYTVRDVRKLYDDGCIGIIADDGKYFVYSVSKAGLALMSCLEYKGISNQVPRELYNGYTDILGGLVAWVVPRFKFKTNNECLFDNMFLGFVDTTIIDGSYIPHLILQYYNTAMKLGNMLNFNIDNLSSYLYDEDGDETDVYSFYYGEGKIFRGSEDDFGGQSYIKCLCDGGRIYKLYRNAIFQYFNCPMYISEAGDVYIGFHESNSKHFLSGVVQYKITDLKKFNVIISKAIFMNEIKFSSMYNPTKPVQPSPFRMRVGV